MRVRRSVPEDAGRVRRLIAEGFSAQFLPYIIYRFRETSVLLERQFSQAPHEGDAVYWTAERGSALAGFAQSLTLGSDGFLNYVVVDAHLRRSGIGDRLLGCHEHWCASREYRRSALDVFESNLAAASWYKARGYSIRSVSFAYRCSTGEWPTPAVSLSVDPVLLRAALREEAELGCARLECSVGLGKVVVGLAGAMVCRIIDFGGVLESVVLNAVADYFRKSRTEIVVFGSPTSFDHPSRIGQESVLRLEKQLPNQTRGPA